MLVWLRRLHLLFAWLFVVAVLYQVYLAGRALFVSELYWEEHVEWGWSVLPLAGLLVLLSAITGRLPRFAIGWAALPLLGVIVQMVLALSRLSGQAGIAALHPVTALLVFGIGVIVARRARGFVAEAEFSPPSTSRDPR